MRRLSLVVLVAAALLVVGPATVGAATFSNAAPITIPDSGKADPYPSTISVTGLPGTVVNARATLTDVSHTFPQDIETLLVAPSGQNTNLMSAVCGTSATPLEGKTITFDDAASASLPVDGPCPSGTYKPTRAGKPKFPAPAPSGFQTTAAMSALNGSPANGTWQLFVFDNAGSDEGSIDGGWSLELTATSTTTTQSTCGGVAATIVGTPGNDEIVGTDNRDVIATLGGNDKVFALSGNDLVCGNNGSDNLRGGPGNDVLKGNHGGDTLRGNRGNDTLRGGKQNDTCFGGKGDDTLRSC
jgi:Ca2+-binding RTX toxin-like protein